LQRTLLPLRRHQSRLKVTTPWARTGIIRWVVDYCGQTRDLNDGPIGIGDDRASRPPKAIDRLRARDSAMANSIRSIHVASFGVLAIALALGAGQWFVNGAVRYLGKISYSVYLIHFAMLAPAVRAASMVTEQPVFKSWLILAVTTTLSALAASVTYYLIESNGIRLGHALARRIAGTPARPV